MFGYAANETPELPPVPFAVATKFLRLLKNHSSKMFRADAKTQVSFDYGSGRITAFLCSVQHNPDVEDSYDLTPKGIISRLHLLDVDYNLVSSYGHFGKPGLPWDKKCLRHLNSPCPQS